MSDDVRWALTDEERGHIRAARASGGLCAGCGRALAEGATPAIEDKEQRSFADGDARIMLMKRGAYDYAYNAQAVVDREHGVIVAADLTNVGPDVGHLPGLLERVRALRAVAELAEEAPTTASADAGYFSGENAAEDGDGLDLLIAAGRDDPAARSTAGVWSADCFGYDAGRDVWACPADKPLRRQVTPPGATGLPSQHRYLADPADCAGCPLRARCLKPGEERRILIARRRRYARRKAIVEPVFGQFKHARGLDTLGLRGLAARPASTCWPAWLTTSASCSASARSRPRDRRRSRLPDLTPPRPSPPPPTPAHQPGRPGPRHTSEGDDQRRPGLLTTSPVTQAPRSPAHAWPPGSRAWSPTSDVMLGKTGTVVRLVHIGRSTDMDECDVPVIGDSVSEPY